MEDLRSLLKRHNKYDACFECSLMTFIGQIVNQELEKERRHNEKNAEESVNVKG